MRLVGLAIFTFFVAGCSDESKVKDASLEAAQARFEKQITKDADEKIVDRDEVKRNYLRAIFSRTDYEIVKTEVGANSATATVRVKTVPPPARKALVEIIVRHDASKLRNLNVSDVLKGVLANLALRPDEKSEIVYNLSLQKRDGWEVNNAP